MNWIGILTLGEEQVTTNIIMNNLLFYIWDLILTFAVIELIICKYTQSRFNRVVVPLATTCITLFLIADALNYDTSTKRYINDSIMIILSCSATTGSAITLFLYRLISIITGKEKIDKFRKEDNDNKKNNN